MQLHTLWVYCPVEINLGVTELISEIGEQQVIQRPTLFCMEKLMKLVSTITRYGGPSAVL